MPWEEVSIMSQKREFVTLAQSRKPTSESFAAGLVSAPPLDISGWAGFVAMENQVRPNWRAAHTVLRCERRWRWNAWRSRCGTLIRFGAAVSSGPGSWPEVTRACPQSQHYHLHPPPSRPRGPCPLGPAPALAALRACGAQSALADGLQGPLRRGGRPLPPSRCWTIIPASPWDWWPAGMKWARRCKRNSPASSVATACPSAW